MTRRASHTPSPRAPLWSPLLVGGRIPHKPSMSIVFLAVMLALPVTPEVTVSVVLDKGGDVRWQDEPCRADVVDRDGRVLLTVDRTDTIVLGESVRARADDKTGTLDVVVACATTEGTVKKTLRVNALRSSTVKAKLQPGFVLATVQRAGRGFDADVIVFDAFDHEIARGRDRAVLAVDAGRVRVQGRIPKAVAGTARDVRGEQVIVVRPGVKSQVAIDAGDGDLEVVVTENGRPARGLVALRDPGSSVRSFELMPGEATRVPSGTWDIVTQLQDSHDFREQVTHGVVVAPGKKTVRTVGHATGRLLPVVSPAEGVVVELFLAGAEAPFNQIDPGTEARLSPGRYVVKATRDETLNDGTKPSASAEVTIAASRLSRVALSPAVADIAVDVDVGGEPRALPVSIFLPDASAPVVTQVADARGVARFRIAPGKAVLAATLATPHGPLEVRREYVLKAGVQQTRLHFDLGRVVVQVMEAGVAVEGTIRFFDRLKGGKPTGTPRVSVPSGSDAWLAPGIYVVVVDRKGESRVYGEVKVVAGGLVERALDGQAAPAP
jgi:hypothetical protein